MQNFDILASLCGCTGWFEPFLVKTPEYGVFLAAGTYEVPPQAALQGLDERFATCIYLIGL